MATNGSFLNEKNLGESEQRVLGCLAERQLQIPRENAITREQLLASCNQPVNRCPQLILEASEVDTALQTLQLKSLVYRDTTGPQVRFSHKLNNTRLLELPEFTLLTVLLLNGELTLSELMAASRPYFVFQSTSQILEALENSPLFTGVSASSLAANLAISPSHSPASNQSQVFRSMGVNEHETDSEQHSLEFDQRYKHTLGAENTLESTGHVNDAKAASQKETTETQLTLDLRQPLRGSTCSTQATATRFNTQPTKNPAAAKREPIRRVMGELTQLSQILEQSQAFAFSRTSDAANAPRVESNGKKSKTG